MLLLAAVAVFIALALGWCYLLDRGRRSVDPAPTLGRDAAEAERWRRSLANGGDGNSYPKGYIASGGACG
jgi:hypothetical protein